MTGKWAYTLKKLFTTGFFHVFGVNVLDKAIRFASTSILVRLLTKAEYGIFTYAWNIYSILLLFNGLGMMNGVLQVGSEQNGDDANLKRIVGFGARVGLLFDMVMFFLILGIGLFAPLTVRGSREIMTLLSVLPAIQFLYDLCQTSLRTQKRNREFASLTFLYTVLLAALSIPGVIVFREKGLVLGYYASTLCVLLFGVRKYRIGFSWRDGALSDETRREIVSISIISMLNGGISQLLYYLDVFVLGIVTPDENLLAGYKVATLIPSAITFIPMSFVIYIYPYFAEHRHDGAWCLRRYRQILLYFGAFNALLSLTLAVCARYVILLFFGAPYLDSVPIFRILSLNYFFSATFRIIAGNLLVTQRKLKFNLFVAVFCGLINVAADLVFIGWWGAIGAACATVTVVAVSSVLNVSYLVYTFTRHKGADSEQQ